MFFLRASLARGGGGGGRVKQCINRSLSREWTLHPFLRKTANYTRILVSRLSTVSIILFNFLFKLRKFWQERGCKEGRKEGSSIK